LAHSVALNIVLIIVIIISAIAVYISCGLFFIVLQVHQLWLILHCIARIFAHTYVLLAYHKTRVDPCGYMTVLWECFMMRTPISLTLFLNAASIPTVVIERAIATYFSSRYENFGKSIAVILIVMQLTIGIGSFLFMSSNFKLFDSEKVVYCSTANKENALKSAAVLGFYATIDCISALTFPVLFCINKAILIYYLQKHSPTNYLMITTCGEATRTNFLLLLGLTLSALAFIQRFHRNKIHVNLSHRYQITENISSLQTLSPIVAFHSVFLALYLGALFMYFAIDFKFSPKQFAIYLESVQLTPLYALTLPIAIVWTEKHVRKTIQENCQKAIELTGSEAANHYFTPKGKNG
uniref:G_PROTEIN_RECEP_F1_2 domain-containing protein n=1 Tax=Brugia timori TaxID=42155 RepID=A0A0R3QML3_9BILA